MAGGTLNQSDGDFDVAIFIHSLNGPLFSVEIIGGVLVYRIDGAAVEGALNAFLSEAALELGGSILKNGAISESGLEDFGGGANPSVKEIAGANERNDVKIGGGGWSGDTNGGANNVVIRLDEKLARLNPDPNEIGVFEFSVSGHGVSGSFRTSDFDAFIEQMAALFGGVQATDGALTNLVDLDVAALVGDDQNQVQFGDEVWTFANVHDAETFRDYYADVSGQLADVVATAPIGEDSDFGALSFLMRLRINSRSPKTTRSAPTSLSTISTPTSSSTSNLA